MEEHRRKKRLAHVRKLMALAEGSNFAEEAASALALAQKVLAEHGLTAAEIDQLSADEQAKLVSNEAIDDMDGTRVDWKLRLAPIIAQHLRCEHYTHLDNS